MLNSEQHKHSNKHCSRQDVCKYNMKKRIKMAKSSERL